MVLELTGGAHLHEHEARSEGLRRTREDHAHSQPEQGLRGDQRVRKLEPFA